jgi:hypothetical protein
MAEDRAKKEGSRVSRKDFLRVAALGAGALTLGEILSACGFKSSEPSSVPESPENQLGSRLKKALDETKQNSGSLVVDGITKKTGDLSSYAVETPVLCLPIGGDQQNQFQLGFLKAGAEVSSSYLAYLVNHQEGQEKYEAWDVLLVDLEEDLKNSWEFGKIGEWDEKRLAQAVAQNKDHLVEFEGRVALFCFNGEETQKKNETIPSGPTP